MAIFALNLCILVDLIYDLENRYYGRQLPHARNLKNYLPLLLDLILPTSTFVTSLLLP
jgi:hypothetical protein